MEVIHPVEIVDWHPGRVHANAPELDDMMRDTAGRIRWTPSVGQTWGIIK